MNIFDKNSAIRQWYWRFHFYQTKKLYRIGWVRILVRGYRAIKYIYFTAPRDRAKYFILIRLIKIKNYIRKILLKYYNLIIKKLFSKISNFCTNIYTKIRIFFKNIYNKVFNWVNKIILPFKTKYPKIYIVCTTFLKILIFSTIISFIVYLSYYNHFISLIYKTPQKLYEIFKNNFFADTLTNESYITKYHDDLVKISLYLKNLRIFKWVLNSDIYYSKVFFDLFFIHYPFAHAIYLKYAHFSAKNELLFIPYYKFILTYIVFMFFLIPYRITKKLTFKLEHTVKTDSQKYIKKLKKNTLIFKNILKEKNLEKKKLLYIQYKKNLNIINQEYKIKLYFYKKMIENIPRDLDDHMEDIQVWNFIEDTTEENATTEEMEEKWFRDICIEETQREKTYFGIDKNDTLLKKRNELPNELILFYVLNNLYYWFGFNLEYHIKPTAVTTYFRSGRYTARRDIIRTVITRKLFRLTHENGSGRFYNTFGRDMKNIYRNIYRPAVHTGFTTRPMALGRYANMRPDAYSHDEDFVIFPLCQFTHIFSLTSNAYTKRRLTYLGIKDLFDWTFTFPHRKTIGQTVFHTRHYNDTINDIILKYQYHIVKDTNSAIEMTFLPYFWLPFAKWTTGVKFAAARIVKYHLTCSDLLHKRVEARVNARYIIPDMYRAGAKKYNYHMKHYKCADDYNLSIFTNFWTLIKDTRNHPHKYKQYTDKVPRLLEQEVPSIKFLQNYSTFNKLKNIYTENILHNQASFLYLEDNELKNFFMRSYSINQHIRLNSGITNRSYAKSRLDLIKMNNNNFEDLLKKKYINFNKKTNKYIIDLPCNLDPDIKYKNYSSYYSKIFMYLKKYPTLRCYLEQEKTYDMDYITKYKWLIKRDRMMARKIEDCMHLGSSNIDRYGLYYYSRGLYVPTPEPANYFDYTSLFGQSFVTIKRMLLHEKSIINISIGTKKYDVSLLTEVFDNVRLKTSIIDKVKNYATWKGTVFEKHLEKRHNTLRLRYANFDNCKKPQWNYWSHDLYTLLENSHLYLDYQNSTLNFMYNNPSIFNKNNEKITHKYEKFGWTDYVTYSPYELYQHNFNLQILDDEYYKETLYKLLAPTTIEGMSNLMYHLGSFNYQSSLIKNKLFQIVYAKDKKDNMFDYCYPTYVLKVNDDINYSVRGKYSYDLIANYRHLFNLPKCYAGYSNPLYRDIMDIALYWGYVEYGHVDFIQLKNQLTKEAIQFYNDIRYIEHQNLAFIKNSPEIYYYEKMTKLLYSLKKKKHQIYMNQPKFRTDLNPYLIDAPGIFFNKQLEIRCLGIRNLFDYNPIFGVPKRNIDLYMNSNINYFYNLSKSTDLYISWYANTITHMVHEKVRFRSNLPIDCIEHNSLLIKGHSLATYVYEKLNTVKYAREVDVNLNTVTHLSVAKPRQRFFQDPATPTMEGLIDFHNDLFYVIINVMFIVLTFLFFILNEYHNRDYCDTVDYRIPSTVSHHTLLEFIWTVIPGIILFMVAIPSFALIYAMDEIVHPSVTLKIIGHQWYWSYEYSDPLPKFEKFLIDGTDQEYSFVKVQNNLCFDKVFYEKKNIFNSVEKLDLATRYYDRNTHNFCYRFDSYMKPLVEGEKKPFFRLLEVTDSLVLPERVFVRLLITSKDVIHSWAVPAFGVKMDACPGRLNQTSLLVYYRGIYYGQCSELCGVNHGFMPIAVSIIDAQAYANWRYLCFISP